jgi:serine/threonine protein kinase
MRNTRKLRAKSRQLRGGRFLGKGTYGCTFGEPPLPCRGEASRRSSDQVSKLMSEETAKKTLEKNMMFRTIDPKQRYFITTGDSSDVCDANLTKPPIEDNDELASCPVDPRGSYKLVFFQMGGENLSNISLTAQEYAPFFKSLFNIIKGVRWAHHNNIVHLDIKPDNIVSTKLESGEFQTRLIDYDLSINLNELELCNDELLNVLNEIYTFYPVDTIFINRNNIDLMFPSGLESSYEANEKKQRLRDKLNEWYTKVNYYANGLVKGIGKSYSATGIPQIGATSYLTNYATYEDIVITNKKEYLQIIDMYMVGHTLGLMLYRFFNYILVCNDPSKPLDVYVGIQLVDGRNGYVPIDALVGYGFSKELQDWHIRVKNEILVTYGRIIDLTTTFKIKDRLQMTGKHAFSEYKTLLPRFDELFTEDAITNYLVPLGIIKVKEQPILPYVPSPVNLGRIQVNIPEVKERAYQIPPTNIGKVNTSLFEGGKYSTRKRKGQMRFHKRR